MAPRRPGLVTSTKAPEPEPSLTDELHRDPTDPPVAAQAPARQEQPSTPTVAKPVAASEPVRTTRMTLDLREEDRRRLDEWAARTGLDIGRPRLGSAAVLRAAIEILTDPERGQADIAERVAAALADRERRGLNTGP